MSIDPPESRETGAGIDPRGDDVGGIAAKLARWYSLNARELPWRADGFGAWGILVSEFMLQQTPVSRVISPLAAWLERWPRPRDLAATTAGEAVRQWGRLGYPRRALRLHACAVAIVARHAGRVPEDVAELLALPGIGEYTARAVSVFAFGHRHPVVDTNVRRVLARALNGNAEPAPPSTRRDLHTMESILPEDARRARVVSAAVMELGATVCTARKPNCGACPILDDCSWRAQGYPAHRGPRRTTQARYQGSDRQVRGVILSELRANETAVPSESFHALWPDSDQCERALSGLLADGLIETTREGLYQLPG